MTILGVVKLILWAHCVLPTLNALNNLPISLRFASPWRLSSSDIGSVNIKNLARRSAIETSQRANPRSVSGGGAQYEERELSDEEMQEVLDLALGEEHTKELSQKVEAAMQEDWDLQQGVSPARTKPLPIKANLDMWTYFARQELLKGNFSGSAKLYQRCIDYDPCDGRSWLGLSRIYWKKGEYVLAEKMFKDGLYYSPKNPFLLQAWAVMLEKQGKSSQALKLLTTSVKSNPRHAASWVALARIHQRAGRVDEARYCYSSAVESDPRSYVALQAWGVLEANSGNVALARDLYKRATKASSKSVHALQAWATLEKKAGNLKEAEGLLARALKAWPDSTRIRQSYAQIYEMQGEIGKAREIFIKGEEKAAACGDAGFFQSWALFELRNRMRKPPSADSEGGEEEENQDGFEGENTGESEVSPTSTGESAVVVLTPSVITVANTNSGKAVGTISDDTQTLVRKLFKKAVTVNKYHSASWVAWAKHEQSTGNLDVARRLLVAGISNFPHSRNIGWFHCALASLAKQDGDINTARACYDRALDATPPQQSLPVLMEYARMETSRSFGGDPVQAKKLFELAVKRFPGEERVWSSYLDFASAGSVSQSSSPSSSAAQAFIKDLEERRDAALRSYSEQQEKRRISDAEMYGLTDESEMGGSSADDAGDDDGEGIDTISYPVAERFGIAEDSSDTDDVVFSSIGKTTGIVSSSNSNISSRTAKQTPSSSVSVAVNNEEKRQAAEDRERMLDELLSGLEENFQAKEEDSKDVDGKNTNRNRSSDGSSNNSNSNGHGNR